MNRIVVLGCAGTGKTTLSARLAEAANAQFICLDAIWSPDWTEADVPKFREQILHLHHQGNWVSDGNFSAATFDIRLPLATQIVWMEKSRYFCLWRAFLRVFKKGEQHQFRNLPKVFKFIWNFDQKNRPLIEKLIAQHGPEVPIVRIRTSRDANKLIRSLS